jgi:hypothetical protein
MKSENIGLFVLFFFFTLIMWMSFVNGLINSWYPIRGATNSYDIIKASLENLFYFGPHLIIWCFVYYKFREK